MASNFVIFYNGREGSTAIISSLSGQAGINVPIVEDLDSYRYLENNSVEDIPTSLEEIFSTGAYKNTLKKNRRQLQDKLSNAPIESIGFKWRLFGDIPQISDVLLKNNVKVYVLYRRSFLDIVSSTYVHNNFDKFRNGVEILPHPQFALLEKNQAEKEAFLKAVNAQEFEFIRAEFVNTAHLELNYRKRQIIVIRQLRKAGVKIGVLFYEDFDEAPESFIKAIMRDIGLSNKADFNPNCSFTKVHKNPVSERIIGLNKFTRGLFGFSYRQMKREYDSILSSVAGMASEDK
jgi:hypothetical protein